MLKNLTFIFVATFIIFTACKKKSDSTPAPAAPAQYTASGTTYSASTEIKVANDSTINSNSYSPTIPSGGGYLSYTSADNSGGSFANQFIFVQANVNTISAGGISVSDTVLAGFYLYSKNPIDTGIYSFVPSANATQYAAAAVTDSVTTGSVHITAINTTTLTISGTYSYTGPTDSFDDDPSTVTNGQFTNISYQKF